MKEDSYSMADSLSQSIVLQFSTILNLAFRFLYPGLRHYGSRYEMTPNISKYLSSDARVLLWSITCSWGG